MASLPSKSPIVDFVSIDNGEPRTTSLAVAQKFNKSHSVVLRALRNIECSDNFRQCNFALIMETMTYLDKNGARKTKQTQRISHATMTKDGFVFLVMGFTGKEAAKFKEWYINEFNRMTDKLNGNIGTLLERHNAKIGILKRGESIASDCGYNLRLYGQVINPKTRDEIKTIEKELQPLLPNIEVVK